MFHWFYKGLPINTFYVSLTKILLTKYRLISTPVCLSLERWPSRDGGCNKKGVVGIYKNLHLRGGVNKWKWGKWVAIFPNNWCCPTPSHNKITQSTSLKNYRHLIFSRLAFSCSDCGVQEKIEPS